MDFLRIARNTLEVERDAINKLSSSIDKEFSSFCQKIIDDGSRVIVSGMGKSGLIGRKISATLSSTGTPSFFMHPGEAFHGDLGMIKSEDIFLALSNSGETEEVLRLLPFIKSNKNILASFTGSPGSSLARSSDFHINVSVEKEACPLKLAPTASTTACLAMGDALAVALMQARGFKEENFARFHPGGSLGRRLLSRVSDEMLTSSLPIVSNDSTFSELISIMSSCGCGLAVVVNAKRKILGIITDGDLRRSIELYKSEVFLLSPIEIMTKNPLSVSSSTMIGKAEEIMSEAKINSLLVTDSDELVGIFKK